MQERFTRIGRLVEQSRLQIESLRRKQAAERNRHVRHGIQNEINKRHELLVELERDYARLGLLAKVAALDAFGATFFEIARRKLDPAVFKALAYETRMMMGRAPDAGVVVPPPPKEASRTECRATA
jgi:hypothetical protein